MQLRLHTARCTTEQENLRLAVNCLSGDALDQIRMYVLDDQINFTNLAAFITVMENAFGNPNKVMEAEHMLSTNTQGSRDFSSYHAEFQRYASEVNWQDAAKWSSLRRGLSYEIRKTLISIGPQPCTLAEFLETYNDIDMQTRQVKSEGHKTTQQHQQQQHCLAPRY